MTKPDALSLVQGSIPIVNTSLLAPIYRLDEDRATSNDEASKVYRAKEVPSILSSPLLFHKLA